MSHWRGHFPLLLEGVMSLIPEHEGRSLSVVRFVVGILQSTFTPLSSREGVIHAISINRNDCL